MSKPPERKALGRGISVLLPSRPDAHSPQPRSNPDTRAGAEIRQIPIEQIAPNPVQPRTIFEPEKIRGLAESIKRNGIIQPLIVQRAGDRYQLVAGERRWRAAREAGLATVPVVLQEYAQDRLLEVALIENIQREDLNPIELAQALERLATEYSLSHEEIGQRTGKDRTTITNMIRLLKLPRDVQVLVAEHRLSMGHARALLGLPKVEDQLDLAQRIAAQGLSVRQVERLIHSITERRDSPTASPEHPPRSADPNVAAAARELEGALGTRVRIVAQSGDRGRIEIEYFSVDEFDRIYNLMLGKN